MGKPKWTDVESDYNKWWYAHLPKKPNTQGIKQNAAGDPFLLTHHVTRFLNPECRIQYLQ
ncbi:hypothetical protein [Arachidicoccus soli]|uniref:Uncharacterized protein n=1 Tax=Arachidicoccus soli TaxID=2341117 RepID=A0A386HPV5_9BACT|nr:hypothetical protein [Arachidicoccus soli]AYD47606.1 hypothetical protein D6B99_08300 [Arachidicoccus soli]